MIVYLVLMPFNVYVGFLAGLFNGYIAIAIEYIIESEIDKLEERLENEKTKI